MTVNEFGLALLDTGDLDPIHDMLYLALKANASNEKIVKRYLLALWFFYHAGLAADVAIHENFWWRASQIVEGKYPRGADRRHFRGRKALDAISAIKRRFGNPENAVDYMRADTFLEIKKRVESLPQFGYWASFKVADTLERVFGWKFEHPPEFYKHLYSESIAGVAYVNEERGTNWSVEETVNKLIDEFQFRLAPPRFNRWVNIQEVETILCKFKGLRRKSYYVRSDINKTHKELTEFGGEFGLYLKQFVPPMKENHEHAQM